MRRVVSMRSVALAVALTATAAGGCVKPPTMNLALGAETTLTLSPGVESAPLGDQLRITFLAVANDSRCPIDAMCFWAGNAAVVLGMRLGTGPAIPDTLNTAVTPNDATWWGYRITVVGLTPTPRAAVPVEPAEYRVTLRVLRFGPD